MVEIKNKFCRTTSSAEFPNSAERKIREFAIPTAEKNVLYWARAKKLLFLSRYDKGNSCVPSVASEQSSSDKFPISNMLPNSKIRQNVDSKRTKFERGNSAERCITMLHRKTRIPSQFHKKTGGDFQTHIIEKRYQLLAMRC